jgi:acetyl-CoA C-acetyltransferase
MSVESHAVYVVDGARTPFLKARNKPGPFWGSDLAVQVGRTLLKSQPFLPQDLDQVILGSALASPDEANIARLVALRLGCGPTVTAFTVQRNCASGLQALDCAFRDIQSGRSDLILAGGTDAMSRSPILLNDKMTAWLAGFMSAKGGLQKLKLFLQLRPSFFSPVIALLRGLTDPTVGLSMGQTAEELAYQFGITREEQDAFAVESHLRWVRAQKEKHFSEIETLYADKGEYFEMDDGGRADSSVEKLAKLKPFFDKKYGMVTPGNSSQVTDGAALLILASESAVKRYNLPVLGRIVDTQWSGLSPSVMGLGPVHASVPLLTRHQLKLSDIDNWEINEAFAAQVIACLRAFNDKTFCQTVLGLPDALGEIDLQKLNVDGGAIAIGHPIGASGARLVLHSLMILKRQKGRYGMATLCIGGGQGGAMLLESMQ